MKLDLNNNQIIEKAQAFLEEAFTYKEFEKHKKFILKFLNFISNGNGSKNLERIKANNHVDNDIFWLNDTLNDGLKALMQNIPKTIIVIVLILVFKINYRPILVSVMCSALLGLFTFGAHPDSPALCTLLGLADNIVLPLIGFYYPLSFIVKSTIFFPCFLLIMCYAPSGTEYRPIKRHTQYVGLKIISVTIAFLLFQLGIQYGAYGTVILYAVLLKTIQITPIAYRLFKKKRCSPSMWEHLKK